MTKKETDKKPPLNLDFFENVLIRVLLQPQTNTFACSVMEYMDAGLFINPNHGAVFDKIKCFFDKAGKLPNKTEVMAMFPKEEAPLYESFRKSLASQSGLDIDYDMDTLLENTEFFIKQRKLHKIVCRCVERFSDDKTYEYDFVLSEAREIEAISLTKDLGIEFSEYVDEFCVRLDDDDTYLSTGFPALDEMLGGGLFSEGKAFYCFTGETNVGKSIVLSNLAWNMFEQGKNVLLISLEMSEFRYYKRIATIASQMAIPYIKQDRDGFKSFVSKYKGNGNKLMMKEFPPRRLTAKGLHGFIDKLKKQKGFCPDVILVDYHGLMRPSITTIPKHEMMQLVVQELRALSYDFKAPMVSVAQLNRSGSGVDAPGLDKLAGSWDQASDMDAIVALSQSEEDREINILRYSIQKTRDSASKKSQGFFTIDRDTLKLTDDCSTMVTPPTTQPKIPKQSPESSDLSSLFT